MLDRTGGLQRRRPLGRGKPLQPGGPLARVVPLQPGQPMQRGGPINPVSAKRRAENRKRAAMADQLWPDRREGTVMCGCSRPECSRPADDLHEPLSRARGGSITDEANAIPLARECHDEITFRPESELGWAFRLGLLKHSGLCCQDRPVCSQLPEEAA
jgi:hypothetical protein